LVVSCGGVDLTFFSRDGRIPWDQFGKDTA